MIFKGFAGQFWALKTIVFLTGDFCRFLELGFSLCFYFKEIKNPGIRIICL
jgi:hypothetical protein